MSNTNTNNRSLRMGVTIILPGAPGKVLTTMRVRHIIFHKLYPPIAAGTVVAIYVVSGATARRLLLPVTGVAS